MSYSGWILDLGHEVDSALRLFLGEQLEDDDFEPDPRVVAMIDRLAEENGYDRHYDRPIIEKIGIKLSMMGQDLPDDRTVNIGRETKKAFREYIEAHPIEGKDVFRWFMVHAHKLNLEVADDAALRRAYNDFWTAQVQTILNFIAKHAMERDNEDDRFYSPQARGETYEDED